MPEQAEMHLARESALLDRLEKRSQSCPGLFPVHSRLHWRNLARLAVGLSTETCLSNPEDAERIWPVLEDFDHHPSQASTVLSRFLALNQKGSPLAISAVSSNPKKTSEHRAIAIDALLSPERIHVKISLNSTNGLQ